MFLIFLSLFVFPAWTPALEPFDSTWFDNRAEITTYALKENRYNEIRTGMRTMIFVTEPMLLDKLIKPDRPISSKNQIQVLKLNDLRKFATGIYDYSVMTSVFGALEERPTIPLFSTMKVAFSCQEWCGTVSEYLYRLSNTFQGKLDSYFEIEGSYTYEFLHQNQTESEEAFWIKIRELKKPWLTEGEKIKIQIIPSMWGRRKDHIRAKIEQGEIQKGTKTILSTALGNLAAVPWTWAYNNKQVTVFVEADYPHRILTFQEADGTSGEIITSTRTTYWQKNTNKDLNLRKELGL